VAFAGVLIACTLRYRRDIVGANAMRILPIIALLIPTLASADDKAGKPAPKPAPPPAPAEVKATVDAFKGNWTFDAELTAPGMDKAAKFKMSFNCKAVAGNQAVSCDAKAKTPIGPFEALFVVAYDPYSKAVHFMGFSNQNEVHDHVCNWKGADLTCNPLKGGMGPIGEEVTEDVSMKFEKNTASFTSVSKLKGGAQIKFEGKGKR
jgi:hypothetical protein